MLFAVILLVPSLVVADEKDLPWPARVSALIARHPGQAAVALKHLPSGEHFEHRADTPMPTASLIKFPVMIEAYRQDAAATIQLADPVVLRDEDKVPGSGILTQHFSAGASFPLRDAVRMMIAWSDNTATNLVIDRIGLPATTAQMMRLDCPNTRLHAKVFRRDTSIAPERSREFGLGSTTAAEMLRLLELLHHRKLVSATASDEMLAHLYACQDATTFPKGLPAGMRVAHKTGSVSGVRTDAGLVTFAGGTLLFCVLTKDNRREAGQPAEPGEWLCAEIARAVFPHYHRPELARPGDAPRLQLGDSGDGVRRLQTALNAALKLSPPLDVDGEFGPQTQAALVRFQREHKLGPTGITDADTWKALSPH